MPLPCGFGCVTGGGAIGSDITVCFLGSFTITFNAFPSAPKNVFTKLFCSKGIVILRPIFGIKSTFAFENAVFLNAV